MDHQVAMPDVPPPEELEDELDVIRANADKYTEPLRSIVTQDRPLEVRRVHPRKLFERERSEAGNARRLVWFRLRERIPDALILHQATLAYASDYGFLPTSLQPHAVSWRDPRLIIASLDHTLWLHRPFRADEWLLYVNDSPTAFGARGFVRGQVFTRDGQLVASAAQEGLIRLREPK
jgi:acyl-CoA thioesterase-2